MVDPVVGSMWVLLPLTWCLSMCVFCVVGFSCYGEIICYLSRLSELGLGFLCVHEIWCGIKFVGQNLIEEGSRLFVMIEY